MALEGGAGTAVAAAVALVVPSVAWAGGGGGHTYYWEISDPLGTGTVLVNSSGVEKRHTLYEPFGKEYFTFGFLQSTRRYYAGHRRNEETGLDYMQARWYDSESGTFLSIDPLVGDAVDPQTFNAFSYARNNPVSMKDPTGMSACFSPYCMGWSTTLAQSVSAPPGQYSGPRYEVEPNPSRTSTSTVLDGPGGAATVPGGGGDSTGTGAGSQGGAAERAAAEYAEIGDKMRALPSGSGFPGDPPANREANALVGNTQPLGKGEFALPLKTRIALKAVFGMGADLVTTTRSPAFVRAHLAFIGGWEGSVTRPGTIYTTLTRGQFNAAHFHMLHEHFHVINQWGGGMTRLGYLMNSGAVESAANAFAGRNLGAFRSALGAIQ